MPAVDADADFLRMAGPVLATFQFHRKDPVGDDHESPADARGAKDPERAEMRPVGGGEARVTTTTVYLAKADVPARPTIGSKVVDDDGTAWFLESAESAGGCWVCEAVRGNA